MPRRRQPEEDTSPPDPTTPANEAIRDAGRPSKRTANRESFPDDASTQAGPSAPGASVVEPPEQAVQRLAAEFDALKDRHLRLAAEFDNYKKRMARERSEAWSRAQAQVIANSLDALDDLGRVTALDPSTVSADDMLSGVKLVERKLLRELESAGLRRVGLVGENFDPNIHEAVGTLPAPSAEDDGTVAVVLQVGYQFGDLLLRPARVHVSVVREDGGSVDEQTME